MTEDVTEMVIIPEAVPPLAAVVPTVRAAPLLDAAGERYREVFGLLAKGVEGLGGVEFVHDLRVASRRLGEVARLLGGFMDKPTARAVEASLKGLRRAMGDLRDADVTCEHLL